MSCLCLYLGCAGDREHPACHCQTTCESGGALPIFILSVQETSSQVTVKHLLLTPIADSIGKPESHLGFLSFLCICQCKVLVKGSVFQYVPVSFCWIYRWVNMDTLWEVQLPANHQSGFEAVRTRARADGAPLTRMEDLDKACVNLVTACPKSTP